MTIFKRNTLSETATILFVILFLYTGISKLLEYSVFKEQIAMSPLIESIAPLVASTLPWIEFAIVVLLIIPRWRLIGFYASLTLMIIFTIYIIAILSFNKEIPCSCGGVIALLTWKQHILFNSAFIALALLAVTIERQIRKENKEVVSSAVKFVN